MGLNGHIFQEYPKAFFLEPTKLERLLEVIHERLADHPNTAVHDHFEVFMAGNRCDELNSLEQVLAVENSKKHRVQRLVIVSSAATEGARRPEHEVHVDFGVVKVQKSVNSPTPVKLVTVEVRSDSPNWNRQTLSQVEEQVERTWLRQTAPIVSLLLIVLFFAGFFLVRFTTFSETNPWSASRIMWLNDKELDLVEHAVNENRTMTDAEMREVMTGQLRNVLLYLRPKPEPHTGVNRLFLLFGIPVVVLGVLAVLLITTCYPTAVFLWGDEVRHYDTILQRRRVLWSVIVGIVVVGVAGKLLSEGVLSWIPK